MKILKNATRVLKVTDIEIFVCLHLALGFTAFIGRVTVKAKPEPGGGSVRGAIAKVELGGTIQPIESFSPYQNRRAIKARIMSCNNARSSGTLFKMELLDDRGCEIADCFFDESAKFFYTISKKSSSNDNADASTVQRKRGAPTRAIWPPYTMRREHSVPSCSRSEMAS
jgi:hypothetical protein